MQVITEAPHLKLPVGIALVTSPKGELMGTVTDGDIRKALVRGVAMEERVEKIMARNPITVDEGLGIDEMLKMMTQKVKSSGRIRDQKVDKLIVVDKMNRVTNVVDFYDLWHKQEVRYKRISIVGSGHVGLTLAVVLAELGYQVTGVDINKQLVGALNQGKVPFYEKGLKPLLDFHLKESNISFTSNLKEGLSDIYIICVGTPIDSKTKEPDNSALKKATEDIGAVLKKEDLVILRSTVSVGTTRNLVKPILEKKSSLKAGIDFYLVFAPERVVEGNALEEIREIPQIIGGINKKSIQEATRVLQTIGPSVVMLDSLEEAEMIKLINNAYRDHSFAFANKMVLLCHQLNLDAVKIIKAASEGYPRNTLPLPSPGVGGYCLTKDPYILADVAKRNRISPDIFIYSRKINNAMPRFVAAKVLNFLKNNWKTEKRIKIYCMGFAFKGYPETSDMRGSIAIEVINILQQKFPGRFYICGYDAIVSKEEMSRLNIEYLDYKKGFANAHCALILNNHPEFSKIDIFNLLRTMRKPGLLFDGWHFFASKEINKVAGIKYQGLGGFD